MICRECGCKLELTSLITLKILGVSSAVLYRCDNAPDWHHSIILEGQQYTLHENELQRLVLQADVIRKDVPGRALYKKDFSY